MVIEDYTKLLGFIFQITNRTANNLTNIGRIDERISRSGFTPRVIKKVKEDSRSMTIHCSTKIEGNVLTLDQVKSLIDGREVMAEKKSIDEVRNYMKALENIDSYDVDLGGILGLHYGISLGVIKNPDASGKIREIQNYVGKERADGSIEIVYTPPPPGEVPSMMDELVKWIELANGNVHPVIQAGLCHYAIAMIHPFEDGNGRVARALATLILRKRGFDRRGIYSIDEYYLQNKSREYYSALKMADESEGNMTQWIEYYTTGVYYSVTKAFETMKTLEKAIDLNKRQKKALKHIMKHGTITNREYRKLNKVTNFTAHKDLKDMVVKDIIHAEGKGKATKYTVPQMEIVLEEVSVP